MKFLLRIALRYGLTALTIYGLLQYTPQYLTLTPPIQGVLVAALIVAVLNALVRPVLKLITMPIGWVAGALAIIIVNGVFIQLVSMIADGLPNLLQLEITGGLMGWVVIALALGISNWIVKIIT
jgi:putative membrane protein